MSKSLKILLVLLVLAVAPSASATSCAPPALNTRNNLIKQGGSIVVTGQSWLAGGCEEANSGGCSEEPAPAVPMSDIELSLRPRGGGDPIPVAQADADEQGDFRVKVDLAAVRIGEYVLIAGQGHDAIEGDPISITRTGRVDT
jgi:hypothetical protein